MDEGLQLGTMSDSCVYPFCVLCVGENNYRLHLAVIIMTQKRYDVRGVISIITKVYSRSPGPPFLHCI